MTAVSRKINIPYEKIAKTGTKNRQNDAPPLVMQRHNYPQ